MFKRLGCSLLALFIAGNSINSTMQLSSTSEEGYIASNFESTSFSSDDEGILNQSNILPINDDEVHKINNNEVINPGDLFEERLPRYLAKNKSETLYNCINIILFQKGLDVETNWKKGLKKIYKDNGFKNKYDLTSLNDIKKLILYAQDAFGYMFINDSFEQLLNFRLALIADLVPRVCGLDSVMNAFAKLGIKAKDEELNDNFALLFNLYPLTREEIDKI